MTKLMIVEDEKICRQGLVDMPWHEIDVCVSGVAENGLVALSMAKENRPDIIITDINMPDMNGLELASRISVLIPEIKIIFLSAYDNFEYAQEAIKYGVCEYILKPFTIKKVMEAIKKAVSIIEQERKLFLTGSQLSEQLKGVKHFLKSYFMSSLSSGSEDNLIGFLSDLNKNDRYCATVISFSSGDTRELSDSYHIFIELIEVLNRYKYSFVPFYDNDYCTFIFSAPAHLSSYSAETEIVAVCEDVQEYLNYNVKSNYTDRKSTRLNSSH